MRGAAGLSERLFARWYPFVASLAEKAGQRDTRKALVGHASGRALEIDTVVAAFVHCTIPNPASALAEIARVLRPGGRYLFLEHVRAEDGTALAHVQDLLELPHRFVAAGCHPNRRTEDLLGQSPLRIEQLTHATQPRSFPTVRPTIIGSAVRD